MESSREREPPTPQIVTTSETFGLMCDRVSASTRLAFDAEFVGERRFEAELCLVQVADEGGIWLIDPLAGLELAPLWQILAGDGREVVVHAGLEDLALVHQRTGRAPARVFDVQIAAGLVGLGYPLNLQRLVQAVTGDRLHKSQTLTDWRRRPLSAEQVRYACEDVAYLHAVRTFLGDRLTELGREEWAAEEFARLSDEQTYTETDAGLLWRVKGVGSLSRRGLAVAKHLAVERQRLAKEYDRPARAILKDHLLVEIARHGWKSRKELQSLRGLHLRVETLNRIIAAVGQGLNTPADECPARRRPEQPTDSEDTICKLLSAVLHDFSRSASIAYPLLATQRDIQSLVLSHCRGDHPSPHCALARGWRRQAIGGLIEDLLSGRQTVRVMRGPGGPRLVVE